MNIKPSSASDIALLSNIGQFIQAVRLQQNKSQQQVADAAGISRTTISQVEKGGGGTLLTLVQILRVLDQLQVLNGFEVEQQVSPLQLAKLELGKRKRARNTNNAGDDTGFKSTW